MPSLLSIAVFVAVLVLIQVAVALPWLIVLLRTPNRSWVKWLGVVVGGIVLIRVVRILASTVVALPSANDSVLEYLGRAYGSLLHLQLIADLFIGVFVVLLRVWPKGAAVGLSAFREGIRQPMFWLLAGFGLFIMAIIPFVPYFTFGEDYLMVKELGQDIIMLMALLFGAILASTSISEEIEGRTAVTLMSKPVSRRQFLLGKYVGILLAALVITALLGWFFDWMLLFKRWYDQVDPVPFPPRAAALAEMLSPVSERAFLRGALWWIIDAAEALPGLVLGFGQIMILLAVAVCLATRLPVAANVTICAVVYVLSHLSPILVASVQPRGPADAEVSTVTSMLLFVAHLFDRVLPALQLTKPTQITDVPVPLSDMAIYAGEVTLYAIMYTAIVLLFGLVLFEDRDLA